VGTGTAIAGYNSSIILSPQLATVFPFYLHLGPYIFHPHFFFEGLSYVIAFGVYFLLRRRFRDPIVTPLRWAVLAAAVAGAALGAKLLFWLEDPQLTWHSLHDPAYFIGGKTIVGALVFGLITVELTKRYIGLRDSTGDLYAIPLALGIAIGRIGCFLTGLADNTYGTPSNLPWAVDFGDGVRRHPTQIYEIILLLALIPFLYRILRSIVPAAKANCHFEGAGANATASRETCFPSVSRDQRWQPGDAFKFFMVAYMSFRLLCDFIKPYPRIFLGLGGIQWACVLILLYYFRDVARWLKLSKGPAMTQ
jgi:phosphatidylglycerol:prolipoprotein diacylglycerol transferase